MEHFVPRAITPNGFIPSHGRENGLLMLKPELRFLLLTVPLLLSACDRKAGSGPSGQAPPAPPGPLGFAPVSYFENRCSRCHGAYGSMYPQRTRTSYDALKHKIAEMAAGQGQAPLDEKQLEAETAYHHALLSGTPFVAVVQATGSPEGLTLSGETMPGTVLAITAGDFNATATPAGHTFSVKLPPGTELSQVRIHAEREGKQSTLSPGRHAYTSP